MIKNKIQIIDSGVGNIGSVANMLKKIGCQVDVNGKPRLACRARVKENDKISHMATLPVIKD